MNSIDSRIAIGGMAARSQSKTEKLNVKNIPAQSGSVHTHPNPVVQTDMSFSTYGSRNEHMAVLIKNKETGEVIREIPSKEIQKLHVHLEVMV
jgi:uncharacterized FlaG/YvyC family protein